jgi:hypothetical protein
MTSPSKANVAGFVLGQLEFGFTLANIAANLKSQSVKHLRRRKRNAAAIATDVRRLTALVESSDSRTEILARCSELEQLLSKVAAA